MHFNYEDLKRGSVTKDRIKEIVKDVFADAKSIYSDSETPFLSSEEKEKRKSNLFDRLQKIFFTSQITAPEKISKFNEEKAFDEKILQNEKIIANNIAYAIALIEQENAFMWHAKLERQKQALLLELEMKKREMEEKYGRELSDQILAENLKAQNELIAKLSALSEEIKHLKLELLNLQKRDSELAYIIAVAEKNIHDIIESHARYIVEHSDEIDVNGRSLAEAIPDKDDRLAFVVKDLKIQAAGDLKKQQARVRKDKEFQTVIHQENNGTNVQFAYKKHQKNIERDLAHEEHVIDDEFFQLRKEGFIASGILPAIVSLAEAKKAIFEYDSNCKVSKILDQLQPNLKQFAAGIEERAENWNAQDQIIAQLKEKHKDIKSIDEKYHAFNITPGKQNTDLFNSLDDDLFNSGFAEIASTFKKTNHITSGLAGQLISDYLEEANAHPSENSKRLSS